MLNLPSSLKVTRLRTAEAELVAKARKYVEAEERAPGIHATEILDPLKAWWSRMDPKPLSDREVMTFFPGKILHALVLRDSAPTGSDAGDRGGVTTLEVAGAGKTDEGSFVSSELGITYSPDKLVRGKVREFKSTRSFYEPKSISDLRIYAEQLLVYMAATDTTESQLWILYLNLRDKASGKTSPEFRVFNFSIDPSDLKILKSDIRKVGNDLKNALQLEDSSSLPLCRDWKCGAKNCEWYAKCKPRGRYGTPKFDGPA